MLGRLPTVWEYYKEHIDSNVNLLDNPKQCCPFHKEDTPSFSYLRERDLWSCFGACHARGKDVIDMHQRVYKYSTREQAENSLRQLYGCKMRYTDKLAKKDVIIDENGAELKGLLSEAKIRARTVDRWLELDQFMTKYPIELIDLKQLLERWRNEDCNISV